MIEPENTEQLTEVKHVLSFGEHLYVERKKQDLSVADVAREIHLSEKVIEAIERSDVNQLPEPTFVQGYLRAYAKYLGISEALVLEEYAHAVPHEKETRLQPRPVSPDEASSNSPIVKMVTISLLAIMVAAALYTSFSYYKNAILVDDVALDDKTSLLLPESELTEQSDIENSVPPVPFERADMGQNIQAEPSQSAQAELDQNIQVEPNQSINVESSSNVEKQKSVVSSTVKKPELSATVDAENVPSEVIQNNTASQKPVNQFVVKGDDVVKLLTVQPSWIEVDDANGENLYYDLLQQDQQITLKGTAPFKIFLGNAPQVTVTINDISVNLERFIRSNNIAKFRISVEQQQVVFH